MLKENAIKSHVLDILRLIMICKTSTECPKCGSANITAESHDGDATLSEHCSCGDCAATWINFYEFSGQMITNG